MDALSMQLLGRPALSASLEGTGGGRLADVSVVLGIVSLSPREMLLGEHLSTVAICVSEYCW
jgi:hypothetical protein